jgi:hypothetical protein
VEKEAENHSGKEKNRNGDFCKEKKIAFLLEWGRISLDKDLLMGDPLPLPFGPFRKLSAFFVERIKFVDFYGWMYF